jgi:exodeoxyribonuclease VII large subunit
MSEQLVFGVSDFVAYVNQTLEAAYSYVTIEGELSNLRVSRNRWVYFDLKDDAASVRFFGTVYSLPGPLENGMVVRVSGNPRMHAQYGFSVNIQTIAPVGEGSLRRAADLLVAKLQAEGLFVAERKRSLPYPPQRVALLTAAASAAYADFLKIVHTRWRGLTIEHFDVQVQGEPAVAQIVSAIAAANALPEPPEILILTRGGGSADDLAAFNAEPVVRAVAASRIPTLVAVGHEVDVSLAELAADQRASTPSNAAELLTPDRIVVLKRLHEVRQSLDASLMDFVRQRRDLLSLQRAGLTRELQAVFRAARTRLRAQRKLLEAYDPTAALQRGYALVRAGGVVIRSVEALPTGLPVAIQLSDGVVRATITDKEPDNGKKG